MKTEEKPSNPYVYPNTTIDNPDRGNRENLKTTIHAGMKLRDYFAGLAMQANIHHCFSVNSCEEIAVMSYEIADEMLKQREQ